MQLDVIGKKLADNYLYANLNGQGKLQIWAPVPTQIQIGPFKSL